LSVQATAESAAEVETDVAARLVGMSAPGSVAFTKEIFEQVAC
jgi:hypothetical protein